MSARDRVPCRLCGTTEHNITNVTLDGERIDACCERCVLVAQFVPGLGTSIARFARLAAVTDLRCQLLGAAHNWRATQGEHRARHWYALLESLNALSAMAMEAP